MRFPAVLIGLALLLGGCQTLHNVPVDDRSRVYNASYDEVWGAMVAMYAANGYTIENMDREAGFISTGYKTNSGVQAALVGRQRFRGNALLAELGPDRTRVTLTFQAEQGNAFGAQSSATMTGSQAREVYATWLNNIQVTINNGRRGTADDPGLLPSDYEAKAFPYEVEGNHYALASCSPPKLGCMIYRYAYNGEVLGGTVSGPASWGEKKMREAAEDAIRRATGR